jgi:hypothetical protein
MNIDFKANLSGWSPVPSQIRSARVELVPFPVNFVTMNFHFGMTVEFLDVFLIPPLARKH